ERELTVRAALGGGRARLVRQLLTESVVLAAAGGVGGLALAIVGVRWAAAAMPPEIAHVTPVGMRAPVYLFSTALTIATGIAFGLLPALRATSPHSSARASGLTRAGGRSAGHHRVAGMLVIGEVALAVLLVITATLLARSFADLRDISPGFRAAHLIVARVSPPTASYVDKTRATSLYDAILARASALPGVTDVAAVDRLPMTGGVYGIALRVEGQFENVKSGHLYWSDHQQTVTPGYFDTFGIPILRGRRFTSQDVDGALPVALVSQSVA